MVVSNAAVLEFSQGRPLFSPAFGPFSLANGTNFARARGSQVGSALLTGHELSVQTSTQGTTAHEQVFNSSGQKLEPDFANL